MATVSNWIDHLNKPAEEGAGAVYPGVGSEGILGLVLFVIWIVNPNNFLNKTQDIKNYSDLIFPAYNLVRILSNLDGRKILFTNAPKIYALNIINHCNIGRFFQDFHFIENSNFNGKPSKESMKKFLSKYRIEQAYFVDDEKENLKVAKYCGIKTIWINKSKKKPIYIDKKISSLKELQKLRSL